MKELYADVILPLATPPLTFSVGDEVAKDIRIGSRVLVNLGPRKYYSGVVLRLHENRPDFKRIKPVEKVIDPQIAVSAEQLLLWEWMAEYYICPIGLVMRAALPAKLKLDGFSADEAMQSGFKPKTTPHIRLHHDIDSIEKLNETIESLHRTKVQQKALLKYLEITETSDLPRHDIVERSKLEASDAVIKSLTQRGVFTREDIEIFKDGEAVSFGELPVLSPAQQKAKEEIETGLLSKKVALLQGITGSGKTEIYIHFIADTLNKGKNVLYMLPEIALTAQLIERMRQFFGDSVKVYHSRITDTRRASLYRDMLNSSGGELIIGVRSSVLLPTPNLGLVIVDEEHDSSFKQSDTAPRYHGRDTAIVAASLYGAKTIMGSATPSLESYYNAVSGKFVHIQLNERYSGVDMPQIIISDTMRAARRGEKISHFNKALLDAMDKALSNGKQVILFQNRRGYSPYIECGNCGWTAGCPDCNVTLTSHKSDSTLRCHYCGYQTRIPTSCPSCKHSDLQPRGFGTEKVEHELAAIYPDAVIDRLDADTARSDNGYRRVISGFENGHTDILIGTQMITKGFDFGNVTVVGILNADNMLNYPDFRATERAFSTMMQVGGRAGRRDEQGTVIIQTSQPTHPTLGQLIKGDYEAMVAAALAERQSFLYPPYCRLIAITLRHRDHDTVWQYAKELATIARPVFGRRLLGPEAPAVDRIRNQHLVGLILKIEKQNSAARAKRILLEMITKISATKELRSVDVIIDVDPQ